MKQILAILVFLLGLTTTVLAQQPWEHGRLRVSDNQRFLQHEDGTPFFWLGETAWLMPQRLNRDEVQYYLQMCHDAEYNMVQVQVMNEVPSYNVYGQKSLKVEADGSWSMVDEYWEYMDHIVHQAERQGIYIGMVCIWGGLVKSGKMDVSQAKAYGAFLANRYKNRKNITGKLEKNKFCPWCRKETLHKETKVK